MWFVLNRLGSKEMNEKEDDELGSGKHLPFM
jgi:hypothetical protein